MFKNNPRFSEITQSFQKESKDFRNNPELRKVQDCSRLYKTCMKHLNYTLARYCSLSLNVACEGLDLCAVSVSVCFKVSKGYEDQEGL